MLIEWSNADSAYVVPFPEWERAGQYANTHGATYAEAVQRGQETLGFLIADAEAKGGVLPRPSLVHDHAYSAGGTAQSLAAENGALTRELDNHSAKSASEAMP
jgi:predicted RNase H-like HicB family nuclease